MEYKKDNIVFYVGKFTNCHNKEYRVTKRMGTYYDIESTKTYDIFEHVYSVINSVHRDDLIFIREK